MALDVNQDNVNQDGRLDSLDCRAFKSDYLMSYFY